MIYYFIYETTCTVNGKKYRGIHKTDNVNDNYLGSGVAFKHAVKKYGKGNFAREILEYCDSYDELIEREKTFVDDDWIKRKDNYNLKTGGQSAGLLSEESKKKISKTLKEGYDSGRIKHMNHMNDEVKEKISKTMKEKYENGFTPFKKRKYTSLSEEHKNKISDSLIDFYEDNYEFKKEKGENLKNFYKENPDAVKRISSKLKEKWKFEDHPNKGKIAWNKGKKGLQIAWNKGKVLCKHCKKYYDKDVAEKYHFENCKEKGKDLSLPIS